MKRSFVKLLLALMAIVVIMGVLAGCGQDSSKAKNTKATKEKQVIRVGYFPNLTHTQALVGLNDGTFKKALGDKVTIKENTFNAGPSEIEALLAGEIDLGYIGPVPAINGYAKSGGQLQIIAGASDGGAILVSGKNANINSVKDLDGKKVAIPQLGNTQDISLRNLLKEANLKNKAKGGTVTVIPAENADILTLIGKGDVDAALVPEPWGSRIVKDTGAKVVLDAKEVWRDGNYATAVVIVSKKFRDNHPDLVEKWLQAHVEITEKINKDKDLGKKQLNDQLQKLTKKPLADDVLNSSFQRLKVTYDPTSESIREFIKISVENGYTKGSQDYSKLFNFSILNKVLSQKGLPKVK